MHIVILGGGRVGATVAEQLAREGKNITVVDQNSNLLKELQDRIDLQTVHGNAAHPGILEAAGIRDADMLLAVTQSDEINLVACKLAHLRYGVPIRIARIRSEEWLNNPELFAPEGFAVSHVISPERIITDYLARLVKYPGALQVLDFAEGRARLLVARVEPDSPLAGQPLSHLKTLTSSWEARVAAIYRHNTRIPPEGHTVVEAGDELFCLIGKRYTRRLLTALHGHERPIRRVLIAGGGNLGYELARQLDGDYQVKVIEHQRQRAHWLAEQLPASLILHGHATDEELLESEEISQADVFFALTNDDEDNIMSSLLAKSLGARKCIALVNRSSYVDLLHGSRIDIAISPAQTTIGSLLAHVRQGDMVAVHSLRRGRAEAMEIVAHGNDSTSQVVGRRVDAIDLPRGAYIAAIVRGETLLMAHHDEVIHSGDHVIVFVSGKRSIAPVEKLFQVKPGYL